MNPLAKYPLALLIASFGAAGPSTQPYEFRGLAQELKIETGTPQLFPPEVRFPAGTRYTVSLTVDNAPGFVPTYSGPSGATLQTMRSRLPELLDTPAGQSLSEPQKKFLTAFRFSDGPWPFNVNRAKDGSLGFCLWAVSEEDAGKLAQALVQWIDATSKSQLDGQRQEIQRLKQDIPDVQRQLSEAQARVPSLQTKLEQIQKAKSIPDKDYARSLKFEFDKILILAEVDMAGVKAKQEAIRKLQAPPGPVPPPLQAMLLQQDVEMVGILARKNAAEARRKELTEYLDTAQQLASTQASIHDLPGRLEVMRSQVRSNGLSAVEMQLARMALSGPAIVHRLEPSPTTRPMTTRPAAAR